MKLTDLLPDFMVDDGAPGASPSKTQTAPAPVADVSLGRKTTSVTFPPRTADDDPAYQLLLARTDVNKTAIFQELQKYQEPLRAVISDEALRFKAALATAVNSGLSREKVLEALRSMDARLEQEQSGFDAMIEAEMQEKVKSKLIAASQIDQQLAAKQTELEELRRKQATLTQEARSAETKLDATKQGFDAAYQRRKRELEQQSAQYSSILS